MQRSYHQTPASLLRIFNQKEYALRFIRGEVRLGLLTAYQQIEGLRRDETEGEVFFQWSTQPNPVFYDGCSMNPRFILCTSHPDADRHYLASKFGQFFVRINDPASLLRRIAARWRDHPLASGSSVIASVIYNKGEVLEPTPCLIPPPEYSYCQKPKRYEREQEFRYVLTCVADTIKLKQFEAELTSHLTLQLQDCSDICSLDFTLDERPAGANTSSSA